MSLTENEKRNGKRMHPKVMSITRFFLFKEMQDFRSFLAQNVQNAGKVLAAARSTFGTYRLQRNKVPVVQAVDSIVANSPESIVANSPKRRKINGNRYMHPENSAVSTSDSATGPGSWSRPEIASLDAEKMEEWSSAEEVEESKSDDDEMHPFLRAMETSNTKAKNEDKDMATPVKIQLEKTEGDLGIKFRKKKNPKKDPIVDKGSGHKLKANDLVVAVNGVLVKDCDSCLAALGNGLDSNGEPATLIVMREPEEESESDE